MNCSEFEAAMAAYVTGRLEPDRRRAFEAHRSTCERCARELRLHTEISCRELVEFLDAYVDDTLPADRRAVFDRHVGACPPCVRYLESYRATIAAGRSLRADAAEMPDELVRAILSARRS